MSPASGVPAVNTDAQDQSGAEQAAQRRKELVQSAIVTLVAGAAFVLHTWHPTILRLDAIGAGLFALCLLPWLRGIIKSVEIPGVGKMEMHEYKKAALLAKGTAVSTQRQLDAFLPDQPTQPPSASFPSAHAPPQWNVLAAEYNSIREAQPASEARTRQMDKLVNRMVRQTGDVDSAQIEAWLESADRGLRLLGYAASYASPEKSPLDALVESVSSREDTPFGQYWGLAALRKAVQAQGIHRLSERQHARLESMRERLRPGTDRRAELEQVLSSVRHRT